MSAHASQPFSIAYCTNSEDLPIMVPSIRVSRLVRLVVLGLPLLLRLGLIGLALWLVSGTALNKYRCEYGTLK